MNCSFYLYFPEEIENDILSVCGTEYIGTKDKDGNMIDEVEIDLDYPPNINDEIIFNLRYQGHNWHIEGQITEKRLHLIENSSIKETQSRIILYRYIANIDLAFQIEK